MGWKSFSPIDDPKLFKLIPFSIDSDRGINSIFYEGENSYGNLVFDNSKTEVFLEQMKESRIIDLKQLYIN